MNAYELANDLAFKTIDGDPSGAFRTSVIDRLRIQADSIVGLKFSWQAIQDENEKLKAEIEALNQRIEYMREKASLWEAEAHAGGFEAGRQQGFFDRAREVAKKIDNNEYHTPED
jgi:hypothetical protein